MGRTPAQCPIAFKEDVIPNGHISAGAPPKDGRDYKPFIEAMQKGYLPESAMNTALVGLFTARMALGMFDPPDMVPYTKIDEKELHKLCPF